MQAIGYKEVIPYIKGEYDKEKAIELVKKNTHYYAKKQRTFFRRYIADMKNPKKNVEYLFLES
jgi:tRNA A37 N6-isopentenylltransferase MiaA